MDILSILIGTALGLVLMGVIAYVMTSVSGRFRELDNNISGIYEYINQKENEIYSALDRRIDTHKH